MAKMVQGVLVNKFKYGYLMKLPDLTSADIPFDVEDYLREHELIDSLSGDVIGFKVFDDKLEIYRQRDNSIIKQFRLFRDWPNQELDDIIQMESQAIGDCTRRMLLGEALVD